MCFLRVVTRSIIDLHGGAIAVYSEGEGLGSTFAIELPAFVKDTSLRSSSKSSASRYKSSLKSKRMERYKPSYHNATSIVPSAEDHYEGEGNTVDKSDVQEISETNSLHILLVDDSSMSRKMVKKALEENYASVSEANDGEVAVAMVKAAMGSQSDPIDVILMDYQMPNMDGPTATKIIRSLGFSGLIIGLTGNALPEDIATFRSHGADRVLTKPLDLMALECTVLGELLF